MRSTDSRTWKRPLVPSAQESAIVFGWFASAPFRIVSRPVSVAAESQERPGRRQEGACSAASNTAVLAGTALPQPSNLNAPTCVRQRLAGVLMGTYMLVNQN